MPSTFETNKNSTQAIKLKKTNVNKSAKLRTKNDNTGGKYHGKVRVLDLAESSCEKSMRGELHPATALLTLTCTKNQQKKKNRN